MSNKKDTRRLRVIVRLEEQLSYGTKPLKINNKTTGDQVNLTEQDKLRILKEIENLKQKITY